MARRIIIAYLSGLLSFFALQAQEPETITTEFKIFGIGKDGYQDLFYNSGTEFHELTFHRTHRSPTTYTYEGPRQFSIFVRNSDFNPEDPLSPAFIAVASHKLKEIGGRRLLILSAGHGNREKADANRSFRIFELNDSPDHFERNSIIVLNATGARLFGMVSEQRITLPTGFSEPIPYEGSVGSAGATRIAFALETKAGPKLVMSNDLKLPNNRRILLILQPPRRPNSLRIDVRMLSESIFSVEEDGETESD